MEEKQLPGFSRYFIRPDGSIRSVTGRILKAYIDYRGYPRLSLTSDLRRKHNYSIHRIMVDTFLGGLPQGFCTNHKNGIKTDNRLENLEVCTPLWNNQHARNVLGIPPPGNNNPLKGENAPAAKLTKDAILAIFALHMLGWSTYRLARAFQVTQSNISYILNRKNWKSVDVESELESLYKECANENSDFDSRGA